MLMEERSKNPLKHLPLYTQLRQEDLRHSKEFFKKLKQQKWNGSIKDKGDIYTRPAAGRTLGTLTKKG